jgi:hypothetical protein
MSLGATRESWSGWPRDGRVAQHLKREKPFIWRDPRGREKVAGGALDAGKALR